VTLLLTAAALLLLFGSSLVIRAVIQADADEARLTPLPLTQPSDARQHRRAA